MAKEKERIKRKKEGQDNNESSENKSNINPKINLKLKNNLNLRNKLYSEHITKKKWNKSSTSNDTSFDKNKNYNKTLTNENYSNVFRKNITELNNNYKKGKYFNTLSSNKKFEMIDKTQDTDDNLEDKKINNSHKFGLSFGKQEKFMKVKFGDPLNPYMTNWPSSFLKIGYNVGFHFNQYQKGVPLLRIQKLKKNVVFPPLYTIQYNKFTDDKNYASNETEKLACNTVVKKLFTPMKTKYSSNEFKRNKSKNNYQTYYNNLFIQNDIKEKEININQLESKLKSDNNLIEINTKNNINNENETNNDKNENKEILILDNNINNNRPDKKK